jgi:hypothetical protein
MTKNKITIDAREFTFEKAAGEILKDFWQDHGNHYSFCT